MTSQLGFSFLADIERDQERDAFEQRYGHLPSTMPEGIALYREMIDRHHETMMAGDVDGTMAIRNEAHDLATRLNDGMPGILGRDDAPGSVLQRETMAPTGTVPKWGQTGEFEITVGNMRVRIEQKGIFGIGAHHLYWPGFYAHAVEPSKPFLSDTGFRSFLTCGPSGEVPSGMGPDGCASEVIWQYVSRELKGKLRRIVLLAERSRPRPSIDQPGP